MAPKKGNSKLTKEERKRLKKEEQERLAREAEQAQLREEEEKRLQEEQERAAAEERRLRDAEDRVLRCMQLLAINETVRQRREQLNVVQADESNQERWQRYMRCDGRPDPRTRQDVTSYLSSWREHEDQPETHDEVMQKTQEVLCIIEDLQQHVRNGAYGDGDLAESMADILHQYQDTQIEKLDAAIYSILMDLRPHVDLETNTVQFCATSQHLDLALWSNCSKNLKNKGYLFKTLRVRFELPRFLMDKDMAVRIMRTEYDHISKLCYSAKMLDLAEFRARESLSDVVLSEDVRIEQQQREDERLAAEKAELEAAAAAVTEQMTNERGRPGGMTRDGSRSAKGAAGKQTKLEQSPKGGKKGKKKGKGKRSRARKQKEKGNIEAPVQESGQEKEVVKKLSLLVLGEPHELNMRRHRVIGGLIQFDLLNIPPQPKVVGEWTLREICEPQAVRQFPFSADYLIPNLSKTIDSRYHELDKMENEVHPKDLELQQQQSETENPVDNEESNASQPTGAISTSSKLSTVPESHAPSESKVAFESSPLAESESKNIAEATGETATELLEELPPPASMSTTSTRSARSVLRTVESTSSSRVQMTSTDVDASSVEPVASDGLLSADADVDYEMEVAEHPENFPLIETSLPDTALWFEPPFFVRWNIDKMYWSTKGFYNTSYDDETRVLQARTLQLGIFGLAVNRFSNMPYKSWAYTPTGEVSGQLTISAVFTTVRLCLQNDLVSLAPGDNGNACLEALYDQPMKPKKLIELMQRRGIDVFPEEDSYLYIDGTLPKHQPCEKHLYRCMAFIGTAYGFMSSRWNLSADAETMVLQFYELLSEDIHGDPALLHVQPHKTTILQCSEMSDVWSDENVEDLPYFADLYHLVLSLGSEEAVSRLESVPDTFIDCLYTLFSATRLLSYS